MGTGQGIVGDEQINTLQRSREVVRRYAAFYETQTVKQYLPSRLCGDSSRTRPGRAQRASARTASVSAAAEMRHEVA